MTGEIQNWPALTFSDTAGNLAALLGGYPGYCLSTWLRWTKKLPFAALRYGTTQVGTSNGSQLCSSIALWLESLA